MPTVKLRFGSAAAASSKTAFTIAGVNSFEDSPYRPPMILGRLPPAQFREPCSSIKAAVTSMNSGSPTAPGSLQRSSTAMLVTVSGNASTKSREEKGR